MRSLTLLALVALAAGCQPESVKFADGNPDQDAAPPSGGDVPVIEAFTANPTTVADGATTQLSYQVSNAETVTIAIQGGETLLPASTLMSWQFSTPPIHATTTFILTATNKGQTASAPVQVMVDGGSMDGPALHASIGEFKTSSVDIRAGESATLSWATTNASEGKLLANDQMLLQIATDDLAAGTQVVSPGTTTVYTLTVKGTDGQEITSVTAVNVSADGSVLTARQLFDRNVAPVLEQRCSECHVGNDPVNGPDFLGTSRDTYYDSITSDARFVPARPEDSLLLLKGEHTGPAFTAVEAQTVTAWLLKEAQERNPDAPDPQDPQMPPPQVADYTPQTVQEALARFGNCMQRTDWDQTYGQSEDTQIAYQNTTQGPCYACHSTGTAGSFLSQSSGDTFDMARQRPYVLKLVLPTANEDGSFKALVPAYRFRDKGSDEGHASYQLTAEREAAIDEFVNRTLARFSDYTIPCP